MTLVFGWREIGGGELTHEGQTSDYLEAYLPTNCEQRGQQVTQPQSLDQTEGASARRGLSTTEEEKKRKTKERIKH